MFKKLICGSGGFHGEVDDPRSSPSKPTPKGSSRNSKKSKNNNKNNENPYSTQGLDKFALTLADLNERRQKIYKRMGSQNDEALVRFGYSNSKGWVPIVFKLKGQKENETKQGESKGTSGDLHKSCTKKSVNNDVEKRTNDEDEKFRIEVDGRSKKKNVVSSVNLGARWSRHYYLALGIVLILLCLVMLYGRSFAIICTCIWWYVAPKMKRKDLDSKRLMKKKDYLRKPSEKNIEYGNGFIASKSKNLQHGLSPRQH